MKGKAIGLNNLGYVASLQGDMTLAMDYYQRAAKIREKIGDRFGSASIFINMANIAIEEDNLTRAKDLIRNAELLNDQVHSPEVASRILASRSAMAEKEGNAALAIHLMREFKKMDDSLRTDEVMREAANAQYTVALVEAQNRVKRIQKEEEAQAAAIERQRLISMSLAVAIEVFIGLLSLLLYQLKQLSDLRKALTQQRDEAESKAQVRRETLNAVVHELRTPMRAIISLAELIQVEKDPQELLDMTKLLKNSSERLLGITNNILTFSRIEEGSDEPVLQKNNLSKLVEGLCKVLAPQAATKGIEFRVQIEPGILAVLDHSMMEIVLMNLIGNALKYTRSGSVTVTVNEADAKAVVEVRDTGPGIPEADQERIFEAFFQSKVTLAAGTDGSGLGLSICKHYVEQMSGELVLSSVEGEVSTFSVVLPQD